MQKGRIGFLRGFLAVFGSNFLSLLISISITLVFPKILSEIDYSYFQLYLFYSSFVIFGHFGIVDGIYLRYGGAFYEKLEFPLLYSQFKILAVLEFLIALFLFAMGLYEYDAGKRIVLIICAIAFFLANIRIFYSQLLLTTARMAEYARVMLLERIVFISLSILYFIFSKRAAFEEICIIDLIARCCSYLYVRNNMPELRSYGTSSFTIAIPEIAANWLSGINLYFSNFASMLSIGFFRFLIENKWDIITFGKVSLAISAVGAFVILSNAASLTLFPLMRRIDEKYIKSGFLIINNLLCYFGILIQWLYFPLCILLTVWLPNYTDSFYYMGLLFPMCIYDMKWSSLESTILKTKRKEKYILYINSVSLFLSAAFGGIIWLGGGTITNVMIGMVVIFISKHMMGLWITKRVISVDKYSLQVEYITLTVVLLYYIIVLTTDTFNGGLIYGGLLLLLGVWKNNSIRIECARVKDMYKNI